MKRDEKNTEKLIYAAPDDDANGSQKTISLKGAQLLARALRSEGISVLFGYPGGANLEIFDVLPQFGIRCVRTEHEQGAVHAAQGYARVTGQPGVCLATSGPGATNLVTGIADAMSDSTPLVCITGNVPSHLLGKNAFQEVDIVAITTPVTKSSKLVKNARDIPSIVSSAFDLARGPRPGPVLIDIPKDVQQQQVEIVDSPDQVGQKSITTARPTVDAATLANCAALVNQSKRVVIYAGGGVSAAEAANDLLALAEKLQAPVTTTLMGLGCFPPHHSLYLGPLGMHGSLAANTAVNEADLVLALGVRFDDRVTGNVREFIRDGKIIHVDIDRSELNKNKAVDIALCADVKQFMAALCGEIAAVQRADWLSYIAELQGEALFPITSSDALSPQYAISLLSEMTEGRAIVSMGVGQHQMWAMQHYKSTRPRAFLSSSGFGTMGYGLPAAIGAKVACPDELVIDIDGDGSFNMTIQELATCFRAGIAVKVVIINNQWLGMVRQWQDMIYDKHRANSSMAYDEVAPSAEAIYPDFVTIAKGYGIDALRVTSKADLEAAYNVMLAEPDKPFVLDVMVEREENVYPMIPAGGSYRDILLGPPEQVGATYIQGDSI